MTHRGSLLVLFVSLWDPFTPSLSSREPALGSPLRVLVVSGSTTARSEGPETDSNATLIASWRGLDRFAVRESNLFALDARAAEAELAGAEIVVLAARIERPPDPHLEAIAAAVRRGAGLVATSGAALAAADSKAYDSLLGRQRLLAAPPPGPLVVLVVDQSHPITQCVTHFRHRGSLAAIEPASGARVIARLLPPEPAAGELLAELPAAWTTSTGRGRIFTTTLDHRSGPSGELVALLLARALEWTGKREVSLQLECRFSLYAESLGPADAAFLAAEHAAGFYRGRQIAPVMGYQAADWLMRPDREETEQPEKVIDSLEISAGDTVADLGAGAGYFTLRLARRVGPAGKVLAVDIQKQMLALLEKRAAAEGASNVVPILGTETDPHLPRQAVDLVLMVDVYHELSEPAKVLAAVKTALKEKGRLVLVEYRGEDPAVPIKPLHRMTVRQARAELEAEGFRWLETKDFLPHQHVLIFEQR
jgi:ubiquinone/menaquinone biosynthesis C-methylase UbiE/type 1 glutamine amidotransferase